jgi:hypothetical protein
MSIRLIAKEIYRLHRESEALAAKIAAAPPLERGPLEEKLRIVKAELASMRRSLSGALDRKG